jgi:hypothetical protein
VEERRAGADPSEGRQEVRVTLQHLRTIPYFRGRAGFCLPKTRAWFQRYGLDFREFVRGGVDESVLLATGDGMAVAIVKWAHECEERNGRE